MWIKIEPLDFLFFRDSRPFWGGEAHRARCLFPPRPSTLQGAIRSAVLAEELSNLGLSFEEYNHPENVEDPSLKRELTQLREELGGADDYGDLRLKGPFIFARLEDKSPTTWFPLPMDVLRKRGERELVILGPEKEEEFPQGRWHLPEPSGEGKLPLPLMAVGELEEPEFPFLCAEQLGRYLLGEGGQVVEEGELFFRERRLGIGLDMGKRTAEAGMLYTADVIRMREGDGLLLEIECPHLPPRGLLQLGGEARAAKYEEIKLEGDFRELIKEKLRKEIKEKVEKGGRFKLYLLTPAIFKGGWFPDFLDRNSFEGKVNGAVFRLVSAAVGKPIHIGGWNMAKNAPRSMFKAVRPGSVYYFELIEGDVEALFQAFHFRVMESRAPRGEELMKIGFGLTLIGGWNYV